MKVLMLNGSAHTTKEEIYVRLTKELEEKLSELSEYSPDLFTDEEVEEEDEP